MKDQHDPLHPSLVRGNTHLIVLAILRNGPLHGYAIASEVSLRSKNMVEFKQGTLYPLLHELEKDDLINSDWEVSNGQRPKRVYQITELGLKELETRLSAWKRFANVMHSLVEAKPNESGY